MSDNDITKCSSPTVHGNSSDERSGDNQDPSATPNNDINYSGYDVNPLLNKEHLKMYGELVVLGYNGRLPQGEAERLRSKYILYKRAVPNGLRKSQHYVVNSSRPSKTVLNNRMHSISYSLSRTKTVIAEYVPDEETDMFQIGRSSDSPIDCVVSVSDKLEWPSGQNTVSRFACRILIQRSGDFTARVFAAGFDTSRNIFLGELATKWQDNKHIDGFTTNGILIMHPRGSFCGGAEPGIWRDLSVCGDMYAMRNSSPEARKIPVKIDGETNVLKDGTMMDLCGVTLLWRSADGLSRSTSKHLLEEKIAELNAGRPLCPVRFNTLVIPQKSVGTANDKEPYIYLKCGHVQSLHQWGQKKKSNSRLCPVCRQVGPIAKMKMGIETCFYVDCEPPTFAFNPCGHTASEKTVKYWASVKIPTQKFQAACPFCATRLCTDPGYTRLILQDHIDC